MTTTSSFDGATAVHARTTPPTTSRWTLSGPWATNPTVGTCSPCSAERRSTRWSTPAATTPTRWRRVPPICAHRASGQPRSSSSCCAPGAREPRAGLPAPGRPRPGGIDLTLGRLQTGYRAPVERGAPRRGAAREDCDQLAPRCPRRQLPERRPQPHIERVDPAGSDSVGDPGGTAEMRGLAPLHRRPPARPLSLLYLSDAFPPATLDSAAPMVPTLQLTPTCERSRARPCGRASVPAWSKAAWWTRCAISGTARAASSPRASNLPRCASRRRDRHRAALNCQLRTVSRACREGRIARHDGGLEHLVDGGDGGRRRARCRGPSRSPRPARGGSHRDARPRLGVAQHQAIATVAGVRSGFY